MKNAPTLSVVIIGRNEGDRLVRCLESVRSLHWPEGSVELIYVDSHSQDGSTGRAAALGASVVALTGPPFTAARARNAGWQAAAAPLVLFLDGDTVVHPEFARRAAGELAARDEVAIVWGHRREINTAGSLFNRVLDLDWIYPPGICDFCGGDALVRRAALERVHGYDETLIAGEEPEMCRRMRALGHRILHVDAPMTGHDLAITRWAQYWRRATRAGYAYAEVSERFRGSGVPFWEAEARGNRVRGTILLLTLPAAIAISAAAGSPWPVLGAGACLAALVLRSAWKAGWKTPHWSTRLLYGAHSHLQQIPIFFGQLRYLCHRSRGKRASLIEYKEPTA